MSTLILPMGSCRKILDLAPESAFDEKYVFNTTQSATSAIYGVYRALAAAYANGVMGLYSVDSDEFIGDVSNPGPLDNFYRYSTTPQNSSMALTFTPLWQGIERANIIIKNVPAMELYKSGSATDQAQLKRVYGEALALRAYFYLDLIRYWGDVPFPTEPSIDQPDLKLPKVDRDIIYDRIIEDLKVAADLMPWRGDPGVNNDERLTKGSVKGIRALAALTAGGYSLRRESKQMERPKDYLKMYQIARDESYELMQRRDKHNLNPNYQAVFKDANMVSKIEPNGEVLFEVADGEDGNARFSNKNGPRAAIGNNGFNFGSGAIRGLPTYFYAFDPLDTRRDVTLCTYYINRDRTIAVQRMLNMTDGKYRIDWKDPYPTISNAYQGVNWYILRLSDVMLMFAESENELKNGPTPEAKSAYEEVRKRGFKGNEIHIGVTPVTKEAFFQAIIDERHFELGGEGIRKLDLIRWNMLGTTLEKTRAELTKMRNNELPYNKLPITIWYKTGEKDPKYANSFYLPTPSGTPPTGYLAIRWLQDISPTPQYSNYNLNLGRNFIFNKSELFPIPQGALDGNPNLIQDYGY